MSSRKFGSMSLSFVLLMSLALASDQREVDELNAEEIMGQGSTSKGPEPYQNRNYLKPFHEAPPTIQLGIKPMLLNNTQKTKIVTEDSNNKYLRSRQYPSKRQGGFNRKRSRDQSEKKISEDFDLEQSENVEYPNENGNKHRRGTQRRYLKNDGKLNTRRRNTSRNPKTGQPMFGHWSARNKNNSSGDVPQSSSDEQKYAYSGDLIRLTNDGSYSHKTGHVQVYIDGVWGYICNTDWDLTDASVACRQLGFPGGAISSRAQSWSDPRGTGKSNFLMGQVECTGSETRLADCRYQEVYSCSTAAAVVCREQLGCGKDWASGNGKCYKLYTLQRTIAMAAYICEQQQANLVSIATSQEHNFLSNLLKHIKLNIREWHTGGRRGETKWYWLKQDGASRLRTWSNWQMEAFSGLQMNTTRWFPGWPLLGNLMSEPSSLPEKNCLALSDVFEDPVDGLTLLDSFYWKAVECNNRQGLSFICSKPNEVSNEECYTGQGTTYRGTASFTEKGHYCLDWSSSRSINERTHPGRGLGEHNFCRNPDFDERPWCWVDHAERKVDYCRLSQCRTLQTTTRVHTTSSSANTQQTKTTRLVTSGLRATSSTQSTLSTRAVDTFTVTKPVKTTGEAGRSSTSTVPAGNESDCYIGSGQSYTGTVSVTENGSECLRWSLSPTAWYSELRDHNYCRNPDNDLKPWCWLKHAYRKWSYCGVPKCSQENTPVLGSHTSAVVRVGTVTETTRAVVESRPSTRNTITNSSTTVMSRTEPRITTVRPGQTQELNNLANTTSDQSSNMSSVSIPEISINQTKEQGTDAVSTTMQDNAVKLFSFVTSETTPSLASVTIPVVASVTAPAITLKTTTTVTSKTPAEESGTTAAITSKTTPAAASETTAAITSKTTPVTASEITAAITSKTTPAEASETTAAITSKTTPTTASEITAAITSKTTPAAASGTTAAITSKTTPTTASELTAAITSKTTPAAASGTTAAIISKTTPVAVSKTTAAIISKTTPVAVSKTTSAITSKTTPVAVSKTTAAITSKTTPVAALKITPITVSEVTVAASEDCYIGQGLSYRGNASVSEGGRQCLKWSMSFRTNERNDTNRGLGDHNFCRNPDFDERPWCWVDHAERKFGYCRLPHCNQLKTKTTATVTSSSTKLPVSRTPVTSSVRNTLPQLTSTKSYLSRLADTTTKENSENRSISTVITTTDVQSSQCQGMFHCVSDNRCIPLLYRCDDDEDCLLGEDEVNCGVQAPVCPGMFHCALQDTLWGIAKCIPLIYRCDKDKDCLLGEDEMNCVNAVDSFIKTPMATLSFTSNGTRSFQTLTFVSDEMCAERCLASTQPLCGAFVYETRSRTCHLITPSVAASGILISSFSSVFYRMKKNESNECNNSVPVPCDGQKNCVKLCDDIQIRLDGGGEQSGTVVIRYNGSDGVICDDEWGIEDATVICRMMGYNGTAEATGSNSFNYSIKDVNIFLDDVACLGDEASLLKCKGSPWGKHDCTGAEIAGVRCQSASKIEPPHRDPDLICGQRPYNNKQTWNSSTTKEESRTSSQALLDFLQLIKAGNKIVGGEQVSQGSYPWQARLGVVVNLFFGYTEKIDHACGAGILSEFWLVTAAHCVLEKRLSEFRIVVGDHDVLRTEISEQTFLVSQLIKHERHNDITKENDIALVKIQPHEDGRGIKFNNYVQPLCLPDPRGSVPDGTMCLISGWGNTVASVSFIESRKQLMPALRGASVPIVNNKACDQFYQRQSLFSLGRLYPLTMLCAGFREGGVDTCDGDSGGPLVCELGGVYTMVGVTSWGRGCGSPNLPGVYTRVSAYVNWIHEKIQRHSQDRHEGRLPTQPGAQ